MAREFKSARYYGALGTYEPAITVDDGETVLVNTPDAAGFDDNERKVADVGNPLAGPVYVRGAEPGDTLAVDFESIMPNRERGYTQHVIAANALDFGVPRPASPEERLQWRIDCASMTASIEESEEYPGGLTVPLAPMLGDFGVAPSGGQAITSVTSGPHGGNMDYRGFVSGSTAYLPVSVEGALFFLGDGHAWQADGEILGTGIEVSMEVRFRVRVIKKKRIGWPRGDDAEGIFTLGNARPLDQAAQHATTEMIRWLCDDYGMSARRAHLLLGSFVKYEVGNFFDPAYTMVCRLDKSRL